jgi:CheY-like chemotaxis protein
MILKQMSDEAVILLVEDREDDIALIQKAFREAYVPNPLHVLRNGEEAIAYLEGEGKYGNRAEYPLPELMLLDLKMPRVDGFDVLRWVRAQPNLASLRIVVLTCSESIRDVNLAYSLGANSFMVKPMDFEDVIHMSKFLTSYWLHMTKSPQTSRPARSRAPKFEPADDATKPKRSSQK